MGDIDEEATGVTGIADIRSLRERRRGVVEADLITVKEDEWNRMHAELARLSSVMAGVEKLAEEWERTAAEKEAQAFEIDARKWPAIVATKSGIAGALKDAARRLRSVLSDTKGEAK